MLLTLRSLLLGMAVLGLSAPRAFASQSFCTPHNPLPYTFASLQTASSNTPVDGCMSGDIAMTNVSISTSNITGASPTPTASDITVSGDDPASQTTVTGSSITQVDFLLGGNNTWQLTAAGESQTTKLDYTLSVVNGVFSPPAGNVWEITGLVMDGSTTGGGVGDTMIHMIEFCLGSATFNCSNGQSNYGYILFNDVDNTITKSRCNPKAGSNCVVKPIASGAPLFTVAAGTGYTQIAIQETLTLSTAATSHPPIILAGGVGIAQTAFPSGLGPVPEPATLALFGVGFVAFAIRMRQSRDRN